MPSGSDNIENAVLALKWRYGRMAAFLATLWFMTAWNFAAGLVFLLARQTGIVAVDFAGFALIGIPISILAAILVVRRHIVGSQGWLAAVDSHNRSGGIMLAAKETGDCSWSNRLPEAISLPVLQVSITRPLFSLFISLAFLLLCIRLPIVLDRVLTDQKLDLKESEQQIEEQIKIMAEEGFLRPDETKELQHSLERIAEGSDPNDPASTFEALDQLQDRLKKQAAAGARQMESQMENMRQLQSLADKLGENPEAGALSQSIAREISGALSKNSTGKAPDSLGRALEKTAAGGAEAGDAAGQASKELQEYLKKQAEIAAARAERLAKAKLIDQKTFQELLKAGKIRPADKTDLDPNSTSELVKVKVPSGSCQSNSSQQGEGTQSGSGSGVPGEKKGVGLETGSETGTGASGEPGRGGGTSPIEFNRRSSEHNLKFIDQNLPPPAESALEQSVAIGMSISAPPQNDTGDAGNSAASSWQKPADSSAESGIILPKHRGAVRKYFDHENP